MTAPIAKSVEKKVAKKAAPKPPAPNKSLPANRSVLPDKKAKPVLESKPGGKKSLTPSQKAGRKVASGKRRYMPSLRPAKSTVRYRQVIAAEVIVGSAVILTQNASKDADKSFSDTVGQEVAFLLVFFILSVMTVGGPSMARTSATLGGVIVLALLLQQNKKKNIIQRFTPKAAPGGGIADLSGGSSQGQIIGGV